MVDITLKMPITLADGTAVEVLHCDFEALSTADMRAAQKVRSLIVDGKAIDATRMMSVLRLDAEYQIAVGFVAACKGTPGVTSLDFLKLGMLDAMLLGEAASDYFFE